VQAVKGMGVGRGEEVCRKGCPYIRQLANSTWHCYYCYKCYLYRRETALQGALVLAKSERLELGDNILRTL